MIHNETARDCHIVGGFDNGFQRNHAVAHLQNIGRQAIILGSQQINCLSGMREARQWRSVRFNPNQNCPSRSISQKIIHCRIMPQGNLVHSLVAITGLFFVAGTNGEDACRSELISTTPKGADVSLDLGMIDSDFKITHVKSCCPYSQTYPQVFIITERFKAAEPETQSGNSCSTRVAQ